MKTRINLLGHNYIAGVRNAGRVRSALDRVDEQLVAQRLVVAAASGDWELLQAWIQLSKLQIDRKILKGEITADRQSMWGGHAREATIIWDFDALMKTRLK